MRVINVKMTWALSLPACCYHASSSTQKQHVSFPHFESGQVASSSSAQRHRSCPLRVCASSPPTSSYTVPSSQTAPTSADATATNPPPPGFSIVEEFYACVNRRDFDSVLDLFAEDCVYEDLVFPKPFMGRQAIVDFFSKFMTAVGPDLQFIVDDISRDDPFRVGVMWHLELGDKPFPFSKGCSFYRLKIVNGRQQIIYARDSVEQAVKPGDSVLGIIRAVAALLRRFPQLADRF